MMKNPYRKLTDEDLRDHSRILSGNNWIDAHIENDIRQVVKSLRANGVNTTSSCQHDSDGDTNYMEIDCLSVDVSTTVNTIRQIFAVMGIRDYYVKAHWNPVNGFATHNALVSIKINAKSLSEGF